MTLQLSKRKVSTDQADSRLSKRRCSEGKSIINSDISCVIDELPAEVEHKELYGLAESLPTYHLMNTN